MLQKSPAFPGVPGPVVVIVMDGYGISQIDMGSAMVLSQ
jgi:2,3-bisphosphoglycerate-independent phosphoglycerate mutase